MLNCAIIMGRLTDSPELKTTPNGVSVTSFRVAVDRNFVRQGEERQADFIDVVAWRKTAEFVCGHFRKGSMIAVQGSIQSRNYEDRNGQKRTVIEIVAENVSFCGDKQAPQSVDGDKPVQTASMTASINDDDDLPF